MAALTSGALSGAGNPTAALGVHAMWGFSPGMDLIDHAEAGSSGEVLRILLAEPSDIRHVLVSISRRRRRSVVKAVEFYILERPTETLARHLLQLQVACDWELPIRQRSNVFLEIFGNALVQERTQNYIAEIGQDLVELACSNGGALQEMVDLSLLKFRERDALVDVFRSWSAQVPYDVATLRDHRLRSHFGVRYDHRANLVDWDYQSRVHESASIIHRKLYKDWRLSGIAFEFGDQIYDQPNRTLGSYTEGVVNKGKDKGMKKDIRGFWIDIVNSPYVSFGVDCERTSDFAEGLFEIQNKGTGTEQHRHHTVEVAVFNMLSYFWEIETGSPYTMAKAHDVFSGLGEDASDVLGSAASTAEGTDGVSIASEAAEDNKRREQALARAQSIVETFTDVRVSLMKGGLDMYLSKVQYQGAFDCVFLSATTAHYMENADFGRILAEGGRVVVETCKYLVPLSKQQEAGYSNRVLELAESRGLGSVGPRAERPDVFIFSSNPP